MELPKPSDKTPLNQSMRNCLTDKYDTNLAPAHEARSYSRRSSHRSSMCDSIATDELSRDLNQYMGRDEDENEEASKFRRQGKTIRKRQTRRIIDKSRTGIAEVSPIKIDISGSFKNKRDEKETTPKIVIEEINSDRRSMAGVSNATRTNASSGGQTVYRKWTLQNISNGTSYNQKSSMTRTFAQSISRGNTLTVDQPWKADSFFKSTKQTLVTSNDTKSTVMDTPSTARRVVQMKSVAFKD